MKNCHQHNHRQRTEKEAMDGFDIERFVLKGAKPLLDTLFNIMSGPQFRITLAMLNMTSKTLYHVTHDYELVNKTHPIKRRQWGFDLVRSGFTELVKIADSNLLVLEDLGTLDAKCHEPLEALFVRNKACFPTLAAVRAELGITDDIDSEDQLPIVRRSCISAAIRGGQTTYFRMAIERYGDERNHDFANQALYASRYDILKLLIDRGKCDLSRVFLPINDVQRTKFMASLECITLCLENGAHWNHVIIDVAIESSNPDLERICTYALRNNLAVGSRMWEYAAVRGDLSLMIRLGAEDIVCDVKETVSKVSYKDHPDVFKFLLIRFADEFDIFLQKALREKNVDILATTLRHARHCKFPAMPYEFTKFLRDNGYNYTLDHEYALKTGDVDLMEMCYEETGAPKRNFIDDAIKLGNKAMVVYLSKKGMPWTENSCQIAAEYRHSKLLKYARRNGAPWDERTPASAAKSGCLECLTYARNNGCPWNGMVYEAALANDNIECFEYASQYYCPPTKRKVYHPISVSDKMEEEGEEE